MVHVQKKAESNLLAIDEKIQSDMNDFCKSVIKYFIKYLYIEILYRLRLRGLIGVIGSVSFEDYTKSYGNGCGAPSDLDLIIILKPKSYVKYLILQALCRSILGLPTKINVKGFKISISYESIPILWLIGRINYINLFELKIVSPKTLLPEKSLAQFVTQVPLANIFELFISSLADLICVYSAEKEENYCRKVIAKRLKFLGYIYCLTSHFDLLSMYQNRAICLELLKSQLKSDGFVNMEGFNCTELDSLIDFFSKVFAKYVLGLKIVKVSNSRSVSDMIVDNYLSILRSRKEKKLFKLLASLFKYILWPSVESLADLKFHIKYGCSLSDFLRLAVLIIADRIVRKKHVHKNTISSLCYMWEKVMM